MQVVRETQLALFSQPHPDAELAQSGVKVPYQLHCWPAATELAAIELRDDDEAGLRLELVRELVTAELLVPPLLLGQPRVMFLANAPDAVSCDVAQFPFALAPGTNAEAPSALSFSDQLALLMLLAFIKLTHALVSLLATPPLPSALTEPHSVTNRAMPLLSAVVALSRSDWPWVPA